MLTLWIKFPEDPEGVFLIIKEYELRSRVHLKHFLKREFNSDNYLKFEREVFGSKDKFFEASDRDKTFQKMKLNDTEFEFAWVIMTKSELERIGANV